MIHESKFRSVELRKCIYVEYLENVKKYEGKYKRKLFDYEKRAIMLSTTHNVVFNKPPILKNNWRKMHGLVKFKKGWM